jgi:outer membrane protein
MRSLIKLLLPVAFIACLPSSSNAQRIAYVNTDYILENLPQYKAAQDQLDDLTKKWKSEIQQRVKNIDKLYSKYKAEKVLLPKDEKQQMQEKIAQKEKALKKYKEDKFGDKGKLFQKRKELVKPIQDRVFDAVQKLAKDQSLDIIFDKAGATTMLYTNARYDRSDKVLKLMGIDPNKNEDQEEQDKRDLPDAPDGAGDRPNNRNDESR